MHEAAGIRVKAVNGSYPNSRAFYAIDLDEGKAFAIPAEGSADYGTDYGTEADGARAATGRD